MARFFCLALCLALAGAFSPGFAPNSAIVSSRGAVVEMAAKGKVNPALFSTGIDPKKAAAAKAAKKAAEAAQAKKDKMGDRTITPKSSGQAVTFGRQGQINFPKPWEKSSKYRQ